MRSNKKSMGVNKIKPIYSHALISVQSVCVIAVLLYLIILIIPYFTKKQYKGYPRIKVYNSYIYHYFFSTKQTLFIKY